LLGVALTGATDISKDLVTGNSIANYSGLRQPFMSDEHKSILRCASGLGPAGVESSTTLGGWYFNESKIPFTKDCNGPPVIKGRGANGMKYPGVINLYLCGNFTIAQEGIYSCIIMNSSKMNQIMKVGLYLSERSESLDMYPITSLLTIFHLSIPMIDTPSSSNVTVIVGSPLRLSCTSQGSPPDTFTWEKDSGPIVQSISITTVAHNSTRAVFRTDYSIDSVTKSDSGTYTCTVTNPLGSDNENITVTVTGIVCPCIEPLYKNI